MRGGSTKPSSSTAARSRATRIGGGARQPGAGAGDASGRAGKGVQPRRWRWPSARRSSPTGGSPETIAHPRARVRGERSLRRCGRRQRACPRAGPGRGRRGAGGTARGRPRPATCAPGPLDGRGLYRRHNDERLSRPGRHSKPSATPRRCPGYRRTNEVSPEGAIRRAPLQGAELLSTITKGTAAAVPWTSDRGSAGRPDRRSR